MAGPPDSYATKLEVKLSTGVTEDITTYLLSYTTDLDCGIFTMGNASASFTVKNFLNEFTPNGGGIYSTINWFGAKFLLSFIHTSSSVPYTYYLFEGICTDFSIDSAYEDSKASFTCVDPFTFSSNTRTDIVGITSLESVPTKIAQVMTNVQFPTLGGTSIGSFTSIGTNDGSTANASGTPTAGGVSDLISTRHLPTAASISWPYYSTLAASLTTYRSAVLYYTPLKTKLSIYGPYYVYGSDITPVTGSIPFQTLTASYNRAEFATGSQVTNTSGTVSVVSNGASTTTFGTKLISFPQVFAITEGTEYQAYALVNRYNTLEYVPTAVTIKLSQIKPLGTFTAKEAFFKMIDMLTGMWERMELKYNPVGTNTTVTSQNVLTGRTISGTPEDMIVTFRTKPWYNWSAFILDSAVDGILDTSRLGW
jgi:hypothetical protein